MNVRFGVKRATTHILLALEPYMKLITMHVTLGAYLKADDRAPWAGDSMM